MAVLLDCGKPIWDQIFAFVPHGRKWLISRQIMISHLISDQYDFRPANHDFRPAITISDQQIDFRPAS
jgi:hypothetical protein